MDSLTAADVTAAADRTAGRVLRTPVVQVQPGLWLKLEQLQHTGTFKARGAFNRQLAARERGELDPSRGVVAASGGNAGLAHAYAATELGIPATVFVPETAPAVKVRKLRALGADVRSVGSEYARAYEAAVGFAQERGAVFCHAYDQLEVAAGAGTLAQEIAEDVPDIDTVVVAVGGGGLFSGVAAALEGSARVVAVEPENAPTLHAAVAAGEPVDVPVSGVAADSLGARRIGALGFDLARRTRPLSLLVDDGAIEAARHDLWSRFRIVAEHGAAAAWAGFAAYRPEPGERVAVVVCGANTDPSDLR
ncbi:threonine/serine dehydratase [Kineococcus sp. DHX-1]|uniref:threonine/serine dehydratase n=1 Tax=Kineococcus sp. DHX-1 TaxID=3349638 RepID=UPI0036D3317F